MHGAGLPECSARSVLAGATILELPGFISMNFTPKVHMASIEVIVIMQE